MTTAEQLSDERWCNNFWSDGTRGFETLYGKMKTSKESVKEVVQFFNMRADLEEDYVNKVSKLVHSGVLKSEIGTCREVLEKEGIHLENSVKSRLQFRKAMEENLIKPLENAVNIQSKARKQCRDDFEKAYKALQKEIMKVDKAQKEYVSKCKEMIKAAEVAGRGQQDSMTKKELNKIQEKAAKTAQEKEKAERDYVLALESYNNVQDRYDATLMEIAEKFQKLEEERLQLYKSTLKKAYTIQCELLSEHQMQIHKSMIDLVDDIIPSKDIQTFINNSQTGKQPPPRLQFIPYGGLSSSAGAKFLRPSPSMLQQRKPDGTFLPSPSILESASISLRTEVEGFVPPNRGNLPPKLVMGLEFQDQKLTANQNPSLQDSYPVIPSAPGNEPGHTEESAEDEDNQAKQIQELQNSKRASSSPRLIAQTDNVAMDEGKRTRNVSAPPIPIQSNTGDIPPSSRRSMSVRETATPGSRKPNNQLENIFSQSVSSSEKDVYRFADSIPENQGPPPYLPPEVSSAIKIKSDVETVSPLQRVSSSGQRDKAQQLQSQDHQQLLEERQKQQQEEQLKQLQHLEQKQQLDEKQNLQEEQLKQEKLQQEMEQKRFMEEQLRQQKLQQDKINEQLQQKRLQQEMEQAQQKKEQLRQQKLQEEMEKQKVMEEQLRQQKLQEEMEKQKLMEEQLRQQKVQEELEQRRVMEELAQQEKLQQELKQRQELEESLQQQKLQEAERQKQLEEEMQNQKQQQEQKQQEELKFQHIEQRRIMELSTLDKEKSMSQPFALEKQEPTSKQDDSSSNDASGMITSLKGSLTTLAEDKIAIPTLEKRTFTRRSIKMEGWVTMCDELQMGWVKRWAIFEGGYIWVFDQQQEAGNRLASKPKGMVAVNAKCKVHKGSQVHFTLPEIEDKENLLTLEVNPSRSIVFSTSKEDFWYWMDALVNKAGKK